MPTATVEPKVKATKKEIEAIKQEIRELLPAYQTRRLELGIKLLRLQEMLAHHGNGTFNKTVKVELKIPHGTMYDLIDYAKAEIEQLESLYGNRTNKGNEKVAKKLFGEDENDADIDISDPGVVAFLLEKFEEQARRDNDVEYLAHKPREDEDYVKQIYLRFRYARETRLEILAAWKTLKPHKTAVKALSVKIAKEVLDAAAEIKATSNK